MLQHAGTTSASEAVSKAFSLLFASKERSGGDSEDKAGD
jgi:hypothetical protein